MARFNPSYSNIRRTEYETAKELVNKTSRRMLDLAKYQMPKRTGRTVATAYTKTRVGPHEYTQEIGFRSIVALWLDRGTPPHEEPLSGWGRMSFFWEKKGRWVTLYHVNHPGIKETRFLTDTLYLAKADGFNITISFGNLNP